MVDVSLQLLLLQTQSEMQRMVVSIYAKWMVVGNAFIVENTLNGTFGRSTRMKNVSVILF